MVFSSVQKGAQEYGVQCWKLPQPLLFCYGMKSSMPLQRKKTRKQTIFLRPIAIQSRYQMNGLCPRVEIHTVIKAYFQDKQANNCLFVLPRILYNSSWNLKCSYWPTNKRSIFCFHCVWYTSPGLHLPYWWTVSMCNIEVPVEILTLKGTMVSHVCILKHFDKHHLFLCLRYSNLESIAHWFSLLQFLDAPNHRRMAFTSFSFLKHLRLCHSVQGCPDCLVALGFNA